MPITKASIKDVRRIKKATARNRAIRTVLRHAITKARNASAEEKDLLTRQAVKLADRAATKGVIKKRNAARRISRLMRAKAAPAPEQAKKPAKASKAKTSKAAKPAKESKKTSEASETQAPAE